MAVLGIDFDHVLVDGDVPIVYAKEAINILREHGQKIIIHSCNNPKWIEKVLNNNDIRFDMIWKDGDGGNIPKPICDLYVDDRGYAFEGDWKKALEEILNHKHIKDKDNRKW